MRKIIVSTIVALSLGASITPAAAETVTTSVQYADLDLSTDAGLATLEGRIQAAAKRICGKAEVRDVHDAADQQRCLREAGEAAARQIAQVTGRSAVLALNGTARR